MSQSRTASSPAEPLPLPGLLRGLSGFHDHTVLFRVGDFYFVTYGLLAATAFAVGMGVAAWYMGAVGLDPRAMVRFSALVMLPSVLAGARAFSVMLEWRSLFSEPARTLLKPGYMLHGGVAGGAAALVGWHLVSGVPLLHVLDAWALALAVGESICRLGCFVYGCCWGRPTDSALGVRYSSPHAKVVRCQPHLRGVSIHPTQLYASAAHLLQFMVFLALLPRIEAPGTLVTLYLLSHPLIRFALERFRQDDRGRLVGPFTHTQFYGLVQFAVGAGLLLWSRAGRLPEVAWSGHLDRVLLDPTSVALASVVFVGAALAFGLHYRSVGAWLGPRSVNPEAEGDG